MALNSKSNAEDFYNGNSQPSTTPLSLQLHPSLQVTSYNPLPSTNTNDSKMLATTRKLRLNPHLLFVRLPHLLSFLCIVVGVIWLLLLPLNEYSRRTYISENALLPGQVHAYFSGSEQNVFRGFKKELEGLLVADGNGDSNGGGGGGEGGPLTPVYVCFQYHLQTSILRC